MSNGTTATGAVSANTLDARTLQRGLRALGFDPGPIDGIIGPRTLEALDRFLDSLEGESADYQASASSVTLRSAAAAAWIQDGATKPVTTSTGGAGASTRSAGDLLAPPADLAPTFWRVSNPAAWAAGILPLALVLGGLGWWLMRRRKG